MGAGERLLVRPVPAEMVLSLNLLTMPTIGNVHRLRRGTDFRL
jgi:hypothetical protein